MNLRWFSVVICLLLSFSVSARELMFDNATQNVRFQHLLKEVRCVTCKHQSILESDAPIAKDLRHKIYLQMADGKSDDHIRQYLRERYGDFILFAPAFNSKHLILWGLPLFSFLLSILLATRFFMKKI